MEPTLSGSLDANVSTTRELDLVTPRRGELESRLPQLCAIARSILRSDDLARDAVQEALVCLWMEDPLPRDVHGWLVRTVVHRSLHHARSLDRRRRHETLAARGRWAYDDGDDPLSASRGRELLERIELALRELPRAFGEAFRLREVEGLDYVAIAERTRVPVGTVRSRLNRARALLRERLAHLMHDERRCAICVREARTRREA